MAAMVFSSANSFAKFVKPTNRISGLYTDQLVTLYAKLISVGTINSSINPKKAGRIIPRNTLSRCCVFILYLLTT